jgi:histone acetyltransferase (RNA polymerase elongator complex component)
MSSDVELRKERLKKIGNEAVQKLVKASKEQQKAVESAKTSIKRKYHLRKLKKNNSELAQMLISLEQYNKAIDDELNEGDTNVVE